MIATKTQLLTDTADSPASARSDFQPGKVAQAVYRTSYCLSFGVMLPTLLVVSILPTNNAIGYGLVDGARAANESKRRIRTRAAVAAATTRSKMADAYAGVAARFSQRVEAIEDAIAERRYKRRIATA